uniref:CCHC-type domain-containing protein n=1 Tax=Clytia hemisphaerica TaxID=252671 RepID=A0A7M5XKN8_9CNID|eukprot:TCONS_00043098-protein
MSKKSSEKSKSTDGGTTAGNETLAVTYEQLKTLVNDVVEKDFGPQIMKSTKDTVKAASVQSAENQLTNLAKLKKKLEKKRANDNIVLKKTGHQDQFAHNTAVLETIEDTLEFMEETDVDGMKEALNKGKRLLETRIQHIRIADTYGWLTVNEFKASDLTSGDVEEKRLKRAIKNAEQVKERIYKKPRIEEPDGEYSKAIKSRTEQRSRMDEVVCYSCKRVGHYVSHCPFFESSSPLAHSIKLMSSPTATKSSSSNSNSKSSRDGK